MQNVREPVARNFYAGDCAVQLEQFLVDFTPPADLPEHLAGAVLPHAGWLYSGRTAARTLACLTHHGTPETIIIFGADHTGVRRHSLYPAGAWRTPLGDLPVDEQLARRIATELHGLVAADEHAHDMEHSIEVLTPMLKYFWPAVSFVPITVRPEESAVELGRRLGRLLADRSGLVVMASSDLTHYGRPYGFAPGGSGRAGQEWMQANDQRIIDRICAGDAAGVLVEASRNYNACGSGAVAALIALVGELGHSDGYLVEYTTSHGRRPPEAFDYAVGYAGVVF